MYASVFEYRYGEYLANKYPEAKLMTKYLDRESYDSKFERLGVTKALMVRNHRFQPFSKLGQHIEKYNNFWGLQVDTKLGVNWIIIFADMVRNHRLMDTWMDTRMFNIPASSPDIVGGDNWLYLAW